MEYVNKPATRPSNTNPNHLNTKEYSSWEYFFMMAWTRIMHLLKDLQVFLQHSHLLCPETICTSRHGLWSKPPDKCLLSSVPIYTLTPPKQSALVTWQLLTWLTILLPLIFPHDITRLFQISSHFLLYFLGSESNSRFSRVLLPLHLLLTPSPRRVWTVVGVVFFGVTWRGTTPGNDTVHQAVTRSFSPGTWRAEVTHQIHVYMKWPVAMWSSDPGGWRFIYLHITGHSCRNLGSYISNRVLRT